MIKGNIDLQQFDDFHLKLDYEIPPQSTVGFNYCYPNDADRYLHENITAHIARQLPNEVEDYLHNYFDSLSDIKTSVQKMLPGMILPYHRDKYGYFLQQNPGLQASDIQRIIVFLDKWMPGHISEIAGDPHTNWNKGDWITWFGSTEHMAANLGVHDRYTLQITGIK